MNFSILKDGNKEKNFQNDSTDSQKSNAVRQYKWLVLMACFMAQVIALGFTFSANVFYVFFLDEYGRTKAETSLIIAVMLCVYFMSGIYYFFISRYILLPIPFPLFRRTCNTFYLNSNVSINTIALFNLI